MNTLPESEIRNALMDLPDYVVRRIT